MPLLTDAAKNSMLDAIGVTHLSAHTAYSATGTNEVTGGSPAYARKAVTLAAASGGSKAASTQPVFDIPASTTVRWIGKWTAISGGTFLGMMPAGGGSLKPFTVDDIATDLLDSESHGFTNDQNVVVWGDALPTGITEGTVYFVVNSATHGLKLATTQGGTAIDITDIGHGFIQRIIPEVFAAQGTYTVNSYSEDLHGVT